MPEDVVFRFAISAPSRQQVTANDTPLFMSVPSTLHPRSAQYGSGEVDRYATFESSRRLDGPVAYLFCTTTVVGGAVLSPVLAGGGVGRDVRAPLVSAPRMNQPPTPPAMSPKQHNTGDERNPEVSFIWCGGGRGRPGLFRCGRKRRLSRIGGCGLLWFIGRLIPGLPHCHKYGIRHRRQRPMAELLLKARHDQFTHPTKTRGRTRPLVVVIIALYAALQPNTAKTRYKGRFVLEIGSANRPGD